MARVGKVRNLRSSSKKHHGISNYLSAKSYKCAKNICKEKHCRTSDEKVWEDVTCSVCMESPHNAVLLLCSSHANGCRPYMCATSYRFSNCLDQYKKTYTKLASLETPHEYNEVPQLSCPICRGQVKGWTVVEQARKDLNKKTRSCMQEDCAFVGDYKQLRKHVKANHPLSRPRDVDPALEEKWRALERERETTDVISAITSSDPGAIVFGDFVIEGGQNPMYINLDSVGGFLDDNYFRMERFINSRFLSDRRIGRLYDDSDGGDEDALNNNNNNSNRQLLFGRSASSRNTEN